MNWDELLLDINEILIEFGQAIKIKSLNVGVYDPDTGLITNTTVLKPSIGVMFDYGEKDINGTTVLRGDKKLYVSAKTISDISINDTVIVGTTEYHITNIIQTNPAGTNLLWDLSIRGVS